MALSESKLYFEGMFRKEGFRGESNFDDFLKSVVSSQRNISGIALDEYIEARLNRLWNYFNKEQKKLTKTNTCKPVFQVISPEYKRIRSYYSIDQIGFSRSKQRMFKSRPQILKAIDNLTHREYEALACVVLKSLGSKNVKLTPTGNEAGIDFIGTIGFNTDAHFLFGSNGPIRIIGQCKKYSSECQVNAIKEFNQTLLDVYSLTDKVKNHIPHWFRSARGLIIGWMISHSGFQSGAYDRSKNYGILNSDSKDVAEILSISRKFHRNLSDQDRANMISVEVKRFLSE